MRTRTPRVDPALFAAVVDHLDCPAAIEACLAESGVAVTAVIHRPRRWVAKHREIMCNHSVRFFLVDTPNEEN